MKIGIIGTGMVGQSIAGKLAELGHDVVMGTRNVAEAKGRTKPGAYGAPAFSEWLTQHPKVKLGTFAEAAKHGETVVNATGGMVSLEALKTAGEANLNGKTLIDISNPLDFSKGMPPSLSVCNTDSTGEQIQRMYPKVNVVKTLNTTNALVMVNPGMVAGGDHTMFVCGNDAEAKAKVTELLKGGFGWKHVIDLGDITNARGMEMILPIWIRLMGALKTTMFNFKVAS